MPEMIQPDTKQLAGYRTHFMYDPESRNWGFVVPQLHIVGGDKSRPEAERRALDAIRFTLSTKPSTTSRE